jgi:nitrogen fixation protein
MKILIACEYSGTVRDAFIAKGHDAISCDILPTDKPGPHYQGNVFDILDNGWDLMIAHPPCTYLTNSGVTWLHKDPSRWEKLKDGAAFFKSLLNANIPKIAVENPIMHKYAKELIGGVNQAQVVQPYMFGHLEQKATCLWLKNLPPLIPTNNVKEEMMKLSNKERQRLHWVSPGPDRWKIRSKTFEGIAKAMAEQWG